MWRWIIFSVALFALLVTLAPAQWEEIEPGFDYQKFDLAGPIDVFVTRLDMSDVTVRAIDSAIGQGRLHEHIAGGADSRETVSSMATRRDETINYYYQDWGQRSRVMAAINGDFWESPYNGRPESGQIVSGWFARRFNEYSGGSGFFWTVWGVPHIGGDVRNGETNAARQKVQFDDLSEENITGVNVERGTDDLILYTPQWDAHTYTDNSGVEVLVQMSRPAIPLPPPNWATGTVVEVRSGQGSTYIPFDCVVLSGTGSMATLLANKCNVGDQIGLRMFILDYGLPTTPPLPTQDWTKAYASVGCAQEMLIDGTLYINPGWITNPDPRTAIAFNSNYVFFVVVDGRSSASIGMNFEDLGIFCRDTLGATYAATMDGGGSSAMWVRTRGIVNSPSDGSERPTTNGLLMVSVEPEENSVLLSEGNLVEVQTATSMRLGPGDNWGERTALSGGEQGVVLTHDMNGVLATGQYWWLCDIGGVEGWVSETSLLGLTAVGGFELYR